VKPSAFSVDSQLNNKKAFSQSRKTGEWNAAFCSTVKQRKE
jgi:hypothetical protein